MARDLVALISGGRRGVCVYGAVVMSVKGDVGMARGCYPRRVVKVVKVEERSGGCGRGDGGKDGGWWCFRGLAGFRWRVVEVQSGCGEGERKRVNV